jgi:hypothetical protein
VTAIDIARRQARGLCRNQHMADISKFSIVTYERKPGQWRAAITPIERPGSSSRGGTVFSFVTPDDSASEADAMLAAQQAVKKL